MTWLLLLSVLLCIAASAAYSGAEIGIYTLSRTRVDIETRKGSFTAGVVQFLVRDDAAFLVTILIGNNIALELASHLSADLMTHLGLSQSRSALVMPLVLTPVLFLLGEAFPKDIFRRRPNVLTGAVAPLMLVSRYAFWPLERVLRAVTFALERVLGVAPEAVPLARPRNEILASYLAEGKRSGALSERAEALAKNALTLRAIPVSRAMVSWDAVVRIDLSESPEVSEQRLREARHTRLPVVNAQGVVAGYIHQLDLLSVEGPPDFTQTRAAVYLAPDTPVDRALLRLRGKSQRLAVVGSPKQPLGLVTVKDLVEEISGDLAGW